MRRLSIEVRRGEELMAGIGRVYSQILLLARAVPPFGWPCEPIRLALGILAGNPLGGAKLAE